MAKFDDIYVQLKAIASRELARGQRSTLNTTGLVHEAFIKLAASDATLDRAHRINLVTRVIRQITIDHARVKASAKRAGQHVDVALFETQLIAEQPEGTDMLAFEQSLTQLEAQHPRMARVLELSYYAGLASDEIAELLDVNLRTVQRDLLAARTLLRAGL